MIAQNIIPSKWHRRQKGCGSKCLICGCPGRYIGDHRKVPLAENADHAWEKRRKSPVGWQYYPIGSRQEIEIQACKKARKELRRKKGAPDAPRVLCRNSLVRYFYARFVPKHAPTWSPLTLGQYRRAVAKFIQFRGCDNMSLGSIDEGATDRFREWLTGRRVGSETARKYFTYIRAVVREARPKAFPKQRSGRPTDLPAKLVDPLDTEGSLLAFAKHVYQPERMVGATELSKKHILISVRSFCRASGRNVMVSELTDEMVSGYMQSMVEQGYARPTVNNNRADLLALWRYGYKKKLLDRWPTVDKVETFRRLPIAWTMEEMGIILQACATTPGMIAETRASLFWTALVLILFDTGLRLRAALSIERDNVNLGTGWVRVPAEDQKQKTEQRFQVTMQTTDAIQAIWYPARRLLFAWPWRQDAIFRRLAAILKRAGLPNGRRDLFHKFRRTTASHIAAAAGIDAATRQLGQSGSAVTKRYIDPTIARAHVDGAAYLPRPSMPRALPAAGETAKSPRALLCLPCPEKQPARTGGEI